MGFIGLIISVLIIVLGAGYFYFGMSKNSMTFTNDSPVSTVVDSLSTFTELKDQANDIKNTAEEKAKEAMTVLDEAVKNEELKKEKVKEEVNDEKEITIINRLMDSGFAVPKKARIIDTIVLHSSYDALGNDPYSVEGLVKEYEEYGVSAHYLIDRNGKIYRLVEDKNISYHAGASKMPDGRQNVNDFSIGIELMNKKETQYTKAQYDAVNDLITFLKKQHPIKSVVGHGDIAPGRKTDPWNFDWKKLE